MKRFNNKILVVTLAVLLAVFLLTKIFRNPGRESNLATDAFEIDTTRITTVKILAPVEQRKEITITRDEKKWKVNRGQITAATETYLIEKVLNTIATLKPERIVTRKKDKWSSYNVDDSTTIKVMVFDGTRMLANWHIGQEDNDQTYVRPDKKDDVYAVEGNIRTVFNKKFNDFRDKTFLRTAKDKITKITFQYPADTGFVATKKNNVWMIDNQNADSVKMENLLDKLQSQTISTFADNFKPTTAPAIIVAIQSKKDSLATIKGWKPAFYQWIFESTQQPGVYFSDEGPVAAREILPAKKQLLP